MNRRKCFQIIKILSTPRAEEEVEKKIFAPCIGNQPCAYPKDWRCAQDYLQINHEYKIRKEKMILETFHSKLPNLMMNEPNICLDTSVENPCISCLAPFRIGISRVSRDRFQTVSIYGYRFRDHFVLGRKEERKDKVSVRISRHARLLVRRERETKGQRKSDF